jgi:hypothetical protein
MNLARNISKENASKVIKSAMSEELRKSIEGTDPVNDEMMKRLIDQYLETRQSLAQTFEAKVRADIKTMDLNQALANSLASMVDISALVTVFSSLADFYHGTTDKLILEGLANDVMTGKLNLEDAKKQAKRQGFSLVK